MHTSHLLRSSLGTPGMMVTASPCQYVMNTMDFTCVSSEQQAKRKSELGLQQHARSAGCTHREELPHWMERGQLLARSDVEEQLRAKQGHVVSLLVVIADLVEEDQRPSSALTSAYSATEYDTL